MRWGLPIGIAATIGYVVIVTAFAFKIHGGLPPLEALGNWLAGMTQPVAVAWFIGAYLLQRQELSLQREELRETRQELARQSLSLDKSASALDRQTFLQLRDQLRQDVNHFLNAYRVENQIPSHEDTIAKLAYLCKNRPDLQMSYFEQVVMNRDMVAWAAALVAGYDAVLSVSRSADISGWLAFGLSHDPLGVVCEWLREGVNAHH